MIQRKAVILLSGGLDSATTAAYALHEGYVLDALSFSYGQRHSVELDSAKKLAALFNIKQHICVPIPAEIFASSSLSLASGMDVPKDRDVAAAHDIPSTYVPGRNILFLSYALSYAESIGSCDIFIGANALDYSGYPDCRPEFIRAFESMAQLGTKTGVEGGHVSIHAPLLSMRKSDIIKLGVSLGVDYSLTHSCYDPAPDGAACGRCDSCLIRKRGFLDAEVADPTRYWQA